MTKTKADPQPSFDAKGYGPIRFNSWADARQFFESEAEAWKWAASVKANTIGYTGDDRKSAFLSWVNSAKDGFESQDPNALQQGIKNATRYLNTGLASVTARAKFIFSLRQQEQGDIVAASALATFLGSALDANPVGQPHDARFASQKGRQAIVLFDLGVGDASMRAVAEHTHRLTADYSKKMDELTQKNTEVLSNLAANLARYEDQHMGAQEEHRQSVSAIVQKTQTDKDTAIKQINDTRAAYIEQ